MRLKTWVGKWEKYSPPLDLSNTVSEANSQKTLRSYLRLQVNFEGYLLNVFEKVN